MKILALKEIVDNEKRVAITPDLISKYNKLGYEIVVEAGAGLGCGIDDEDYKIAGAGIVDNISSNKSVV